MLGHWLDTADRRRRGTEMFSHWLNAVDRRAGILRRLLTGQTQWIVYDVWLLVGDSRFPERDTETFGHWLDTADRHRRSIGLFCHWFGISDRQRGVLIRLVTGQTQYIARERVPRGLVTG